MRSYFGKLIPAVFTVILIIITGNLLYLHTTKQTLDTVYKVAEIGGILNLFLICFAFFLIQRELARRTELEQQKNEFISMASHELKTPITSLKVYLQVIRLRLTGGKIDEATQYVNKIDAQVTKLTALIGDLLDLTRIQTGKLRYEKEPFNLDALIDETVESIRGTTRKHVISVHGSIKRMVYGDRYRIYQVLVNLLTNAIKYSPDGGKITITSSPLQDSAQVSVEDAGIGIDEKYHKKIFEKLYQVTEQKAKTYPGLGIGLFVSAEIIKNHSGKMWLESKKNNGSTFYFTLPFNAK